MKGLETMDDVLFRRYVSLMARTFGINKFQSKSEQKVCEIRCSSIIYPPPPFYPITKQTV